MGKPLFGDEAVGAGVAVVATVVDVGLIVDDIACGGTVASTSP